LIPVEIEGPFFLQFGFHCNLNEEYIVPTSVHLLHKVLTLYPQGILILAKKVAIDKTDINI
jgi:hypothetical protein